MPSEMLTVTGDQSLEALRRELAEAREQQAATAGILAAISNGPTDPFRVFAEIAATAARLCDADNSTINQVVIGNRLRLLARHGPLLTNAPVGQESLAFTRGSVTARAIIDKQTIHVADLQAASDEYPEGSELARRFGHRTTLAVPLMRAGEAIGAINVRRAEVRPFTDRQIELLKVFANQAVIAIENTRLFEAEQARTRELTEALKQQTATSEVLSVISGSPGDLEPVFQTMLINATRLCGADFGVLYRSEGNAFRAVALRGVPPSFVEERRRNPLVRPALQTALGRAVATRQTVHLEDVHTVPGYYDTPSGFTRPLLPTLGGARTALAVPMLRQKELMGIICIYRQEVRPFTEKQIALVENFASQAVIAIENVRLLNELRESLQQQTATADVLKVISRSAFDLQAVLDALVESAAKFCGGDDVGLFRLEGQTLSSFAHRGPLRATARHAIPAVRGTVTGRSVIERQPIHVADLQKEAAEYPEGSAIALQYGHHTILAVPLLREGTPLGVIALRRDKVEPFSDKQIELVTTFADQAVIAIENARLFGEVQARNRDLTALGEVGRAVSSTLDLKAVLKTIVDRAVELSGTDAGSIFYHRHETGRFELGETSGLDEEVVAKFRMLDIATGQTGLGEAIADRQPLQVPDVIERASNPLRDTALAAGLRAALVVPLLGSECALGALVLQRRRTGEFPPSVVSLMQSFADLSAIALENAHLFEQIAQKSRELEIASQHKSQFDANMSHELRTPLAAMLGYAELMQEGFYGPLPDKALDSLTRIRSNGKHLLGLINTVLDIAKIESGQFTLNMAEYAIESVVET